MFKKLNQLLIFSLFLLVPFFTLAEWQDPPAGSVPPQNNVSRPITIGSGADHKSGSIAVDGYLAAESNLAISTILQGQGICFRNNTSGHYYNCTNVEESIIQGSIKVVPDANTTANMLKLFSSSGKVKISGLSDDLNDRVNSELQFGYWANNQDKHWSWYVDSFGKTSTNQLRLWGGTAQTNQLVVTESGNFGLGKTNPTQKLDVAGLVNAQGGLCINGDCKTSWNEITGFWREAEEGFIVNTNAGGIGIGVDNAIAGIKLDVAGMINIRPNSGYLRVGSLNDGDLYGYISSAGQVENTGLKFETTNNDQSFGKVRFQIESNGDAGLNTAGGPATTFEVQSDDVSRPAQLRITDYVTNPELQLQYGTGPDNHWAMYISNPSEQTNGDGALYFWNDVANANVLSVDLLGNVGIKNDLHAYGSAYISGEAKIGDISIVTPKTSLLVAQSLQIEVSGSVDSVGQLSIAREAGWYSNFATAGDMVLRSSNADLILLARNPAGAIRFGTGYPDTEKMTITSAGSVGIGTASPNSTLHVLGTGDSAPLFKIESNSTAHGYPQMFDLVANDPSSDPSLRFRRGTAGNGDFKIMISGSDTSSFLSLFSSPSGANTYRGQLTLSGNGQNVGIGTTAPSTKLYLNDLSSGPIIGIKGFGNNYQGIAFYDSSGSEKWFAGYEGGPSNENGNYSIRRNNSSSALSIYSATGSMRVEGAINVGVKQSDTLGTATLYVKNVTGATDSLKIVNSSGSELFKVDTTGSLTIAGGSPSVGKVLTAYDNKGNASWQSPVTQSSYFIIPILDVNNYSIVSSEAACNKVIPASNKIGWTIERIGTTGGANVRCTCDINSQAPDCLYQDRNNIDMRTPEYYGTCYDQAATSKTYYKASGIICSK